MEKSIKGIYKENDSWRVRKKYKGVCISFIRKTRQEAISDLKYRIKEIDDKIKLDICLDRKVQKKTLKDVFIEYTNEKGTRWKNNTKNYNVKLFNNHFSPIADIKMCDLTDAAISNWIDDIKSVNDNRDGRSLSNLPYRVTSLLKGLLGLAMRKRYCSPSLDLSFVNNIKKIKTVTQKTEDNYINYTDFTLLCSAISSLPENPQAQKNDDMLFLIKSLEKKEDGLRDKYSKIEEKMKIEFRNKSEKDHEKKQKLRKDYVDKKDKLDVAVKELNDLEKNKADKNKIEDAKKKVESAEKKFNESKDNLEKAKIKEPSEVEMDMIRGVEKKATLDNTEGTVEKSTNDSTENPKENNSNYENKGDFSDKKEDLNKNDKSIEANVENKNDGVNKDLLDAISKKTAEKDNLAKKVDALEKKVNRQIDRLAEANKTIETSTDSQEKAKAERLAENIKNDLYGENGLVKECESAKNELDSLTNELKNDLDTIGSKFEKANETSETNTEKSTENSGHKRNFNIKKVYIVKKIILKM